MTHSHSPTHGPVQAVNPACCLVCPATATQCRMGMAAYTLSSIPTTHMACHVPHTRVNTHMTPANATQPAHPSMTLVWHAALCTALHAPPHVPIHGMNMAGHNRYDIPTTHMSCWVPHTHVNPYTTPTSDTQPAPPSMTLVWPAALCIALHSPAHPPNISRTWHHTPPVTCPRVIYHAVHHT
jgi:hypothetical protein